MALLPTEAAKLSNDVLRLRTPVHHRQSRTRPPSLPTPPPHPPTVTPHPTPVATPQPSPHVAVTPATRAGGHPRWQGRGRLPPLHTPRPPRGVTQRSPFAGME